MSLTSGQRALKELADEMLAQKPKDQQLPFLGFRVAADPVQVEQHLRKSSFGDLLLKDGESLSESEAEILPPLDLHAGSTELVGVELCARGGEFPKVRVEPGNTANGTSKLVKYPGEEDWVRQIDIRLWYRNGDQVACQQLSLSTSSLDEGHEPELTREVVALAYEELGYESHQGALFEGTTNRQTQEFLRVAKQLFEQRVVRGQEQKQVPGLE